jgi:alpha-L-rhamnosidase
MLKAVSLRTEYLENPIGIDIYSPRFYWKLEGNSKRQSAYQIQMFYENNMIWDSGCVRSCKGVHIPYEGPPIESKQRIDWRVRIWDENDEISSWSSTAFFEMGLKDGDWQASWISGNYNPVKKQRYPADYFRKIIKVSKSIRQARLYITACGVYTANLNGQRVGNQKLTPGSTQYNKRLQYQTYDITDLLQKGSNELVVGVGDGWFRGCVGAYNATSVFGNFTALMAQLEIDFEDGSHNTVVTDTSWLWSNEGPIRENDLKHGEVFDACQSLKQAKWSNSRIVQYKTKLVCSNNVPICEKERLKPTLIITPKGEYVLDFGQNIAGIVSFKVNAQQGHEIRLRMTEVLDSKGNFSQLNFQMSTSPKDPIRQQLVYKCKDGFQEYVPEFTIMGFRYVLVENWPDEINCDAFEAIAIYSDMKAVGQFECSNPLINKLVDNTRWSMKGNFLDVPTDCPQRERAAWTGDAQVFFESGSLLMETAPFMRKWLLDVYDGQYANGKIPCIAPTVGRNIVAQILDGSVGWADAAVLIPYRYWKMYGDEEILTMNREMIEKYANYMIKQTKKRSLFNLFTKNPHKKFTYETGRHWGEWAEPEGVNPESMMSLGFPRPEEATAYFSYTMRLLSQIAKEMNWSQREQYEYYAAGAIKAYNHLYVENEDIITERPAKLVRPVALEILNDEVKSNVVKRLDNVLKEREYTVGTGFLSTPFLLSVLSENGYTDTAYQVLEQEEAPGWIYQIKQGATTIWEHWTGYIEGVRPASLNHYSGGSVCEWLFKTVAGIQWDGTPYYFHIQPQPGGSLTYATASYDSIYGKVSSKWERNVDQTIYTIEIPPNCTARVLLPDGTDKLVDYGKHVYIL